MAILIEAAHLHKSFGPVTAVRDINLAVESGEIFGLVGSDGAGKTTTLRLLVGALQADRGEVKIGGYSIRTQGEQARSLVGYLSQRFSLYDDLSVLENIRVFAEVRGLSRSEWLPRCMEILEFVGLVAYRDRRAGQLSGGMKQKLGLASALVSRPRILLLDEPTTGVDPVTRQDFWHLLIRLISSSETRTDREKEREGVAVVISTPYMDEAACCTRLAFMRQGEMIAEGTPAELRAPLDGQVVEVRGKPLVAIRRASEKLPEVEDVRAFGDRLHLRVAAGQVDQVIGKLIPLASRGGAALDSARLIPPTLEDVFISLLEQAK